MHKIEIKKRNLGQTAFEITPIGLGVMQFSSRKGVFRFMFDEIEQREMDEIVKAAVEGGINWFDTAELYGNGHSEYCLSCALDSFGVQDADVVIGTKWFPIFRTAHNIKKTIHDRLQSLNGYSIDLYMIHQPWSFSRPEVEMDEMADLVEAGKIGSVGVSNFDAQQMRRAHAWLAKRGIPLAVNQVEYSLFNRSIERNGVLETARELGVTIVAWGPLASGLLTGKFHTNPENLEKTPIGRRYAMRRNLERSQPLVNKLEEIGASYGRTPAQIALNWLIHSQGDLVVAIPGASKTVHAVEAADVMQFQLSEQDLAVLSNVSDQL